MFIEVIILSIIVGLIRGGKFTRLFKVNYKRMWLLIFAFVFQYFIVFINSIEEIQMAEKLSSYGKQLLILSYILLFIGIFTNIKYRSLWVVLGGTLLNLFVLVANQWKKPILKETLNLVGLNNLYVMLEGNNLPLYTAISDKTKFPMLGDIITVSKPYPFPHIMSIGDLIICFGLYTLIQEIMLMEGTSHKNTIKFSPGFWQ